MSHSPKVELLCSDLAALDIQAIVCPAHKHLIKGKGLSAQIFEAAGQEMVFACNALPGCPVGEARITPGFQLPAKSVIHTVTPQWTGGDQWGGADLRLLRKCYESVFQLAMEQGITEVALPALGAGTNRAPQIMAAKIGLEVVFEYAPKFERLVICLHSAQAYEFWHDEYLKYLPQSV